MGFTNEQIARYYDVSKTHYERVWNLNLSRSLHYGYWDAHTKTFHDALLNINKILAERAGIHNDQYVLDAGCGVGGSALWLAKNIGCRVKGISLSDKQIATANEIAALENLNEKANFIKADFTKTHFKSESFDVIWAIESVCHATEKIDFIKEAARLLKPGGKLILADFFRQENLLPAQDKIIREWANGWAIDDFSTVPYFTQGLKKNGFEVIQNENATAHIRRSAKRLNNAWYLGNVAGWLYRLFHKRATEYGKKNIDTARLQYVSLQQKLWTYNIILASKPL